MKRNRIFIPLILGLFALSLQTPKTIAFSDPIGVFARIDKVVFEPNASAPERIQVWGAFAIAGNQPGSSYQPVQRGYLYFSLKPDKEEICRKEWNDLQAVSGTDQIVAFGRRYEPVHLRKAADKPADPDVYPLGTGVSKIRSQDGRDYPPIRDLRALPREQ